MLEVTLDGNMVTRIKKFTVDQQVADLTLDLVRASPLRNTRLMVAFINFYFKYKSILGFDNILIIYLSQTRVKENICLIST